MPESFEEDHFMIRKFTCLLAGLGLSVTLSVPSHAQNTHGCSCVHNEIRQSINFRDKFSEGDWKKVNLKPGWEDAICWKYSATHSSPELRFELDVDMTKGDAWTVYRLTRVQTPGSTCNVVPSNGHYAIKYRPGTNNQFIEVSSK